MYILISDFKLQTAVNSVLQYASVSSAKKSDPIGSGRKKSLSNI